MTEACSLTIPLAPRSRGIAVPHVRRRYHDQSPRLMERGHRFQDVGGGIHDAHRRGGRRAHLLVEKAGKWTRAAVPSMKKIEAVIRPLKLDEVKEALVAMGVGGMTVTGVRGVGHQPTHSFRYGGAECTIDLLPRTKVEIVVADNLVEPVVATISKVAWTGSPGDGKVFVLPLMTATRIRTGEIGETAL